MRKRMQKHKADANVDADADAGREECHGGDVALRSMPHGEFGLGLRYALGPPSEVFGGCIGNRRVSRDKLKPRNVT